MVPTGSFPVMYGPLYFRQLEREKTLALRYNRGDYDACMVVSDKACYELMWWNTHLDSSYNSINHGEPIIVKFTEGPVIYHIMKGSMSRSWWTI